MAFLAVVTADGGVPIFTRVSGEIVSKLPFATVGALNGVHMFSSLRESELKRAVTPEEKIVWREYHKKIVLILITKNDACNDCHTSNLLDNIFAGMAMLLGFDFLMKCGEVLKLQKMLSISYPLVDYFLKQIDQDKCIIGDLTSTTDCLLVQDSHLLQDALGLFLNVADSLYGCLLIKGKVVVASKEWWTLTNCERILLMCYINCLPKVLSREIMLFLPTSSPQNSNRLITLNLLRDIEVCVLCSSEPSLSTLEEEAPKIWKKCFEQLKDISNLHPRNFPTEIDIDANILSFLLINTETNQSVCSALHVPPSSKSSSSPVVQNQQEALRTLYKIVVGTYFKSRSADADRKLCADNTCPEFDYGDVENGNCEPREYYLCLDGHKGYVLKENRFEIYLVFTNDIPNYALRSVSCETLKLLTGKKIFPRT